MNDILSVIEISLSCLLILSAWAAGRQAARLAASGSAERLHRKSRKLLFRTGLVMFVALLAVACMLSTMVSTSSAFQDDVAWLGLPLIGLPLLAVSSIAMPKVWRLWKQTSGTGGPLDAAMRSRLAGAGMVRLYQATAVAAAAALYFILVSPVSSNPEAAATPLYVIIAVMLCLWLRRERRWRRALQLFGIV